MVGVLKSFGKVDVGGVNRDFQSYLHEDPEIQAIKGDRIAAVGTLLARRQMGLAAEATKATNNNGPEGNESGVGDLSLDNNAVVDLKDKEKNKKLVDGDEVPVGLDPSDLALEAAAIAVASALSEAAQKSISENHQEVSGEELLAARFFETACRPEIVGIPVSGVDKVGKDSNSVSELVGLELQELPQGNNQDSEKAQNHQVSVGIGEAEVDSGEGLVGQRDVNQVALKLSKEKILGVDSSSAELLQARIQREPSLVNNSTAVSSNQQLDSGFLTQVVEVLGAYKQGASLSEEHSSSLLNVKVTDFELDKPISQLPIDSGDSGAVGVVDDNTISDGFSSEMPKQGNAEQHQKQQLAEKGQDSIGVYSVSGAKAGERPTIVGPIIDKSDRGPVGRPQLADAYINIDKKTESSILHIVGKENSELSGNGEFAAATKSSLISHDEVKIPEGIAEVPQVDLVVNSSQGVHHSSAGEGLSKPVSDPARHVRNNVELWSVIHDAMQRVKSESPRHLSVDVRLADGASIGLELRMGSMGIEASFKSDSQGLLKALESQWASFVERTASEPIRVASTAFEGKAAPDWTGGERNAQERHEAFEDVAAAASLAGEEWNEEKFSVELPSAKELIPMSQLGRLNIYA